MTTSNDSQIREHCTHCPVPGLCPGSSHGWMSFWGLHLPLPWGAAPVSSWEWLDSPDTGRTPFYFPFYVHHPLPTPVPVDRIPVCCTPDPGPFQCLKVRWDCTQRRGQSWAYPGGDHFNQKVKMIRRWADAQGALLLLAPRSRQRRPSGAAAALRSLPTPLRQGPSSQWAWLFTNPPALTGQWKRLRS